MKNALEEQGYAVETAMDGRSGLTAQDAWRPAALRPPQPPARPRGFGGTVNGAFHGSELAYLFPSVFAKAGLVYTDDDHRLAELLIGYWARFAATGDPNGRRRAGLAALRSEQRPVPRDRSRHDGR